MIRVTLVAALTLLATGDLLTARSSPASAQLVASVLPASRSVRVGTPATVFATIINAGSETATGCSITPAMTIPATFAYQATDPTTNDVTGPPNTPVNIPAGEYQSFVIAFTPTATLPTTDVQLTFKCANTEPAPVFLRVNTLRLSADLLPVPDIVAIAAAEGGTVSVPGAFAVAISNVGAGANRSECACSGGDEPCSFLKEGIEVRAAGPASVTATVCKTHPSTGTCLAPPAPIVFTPIDAGEQASFAVFVGGDAAGFDPATNRIEVRFTHVRDILFNQFHCPVPGDYSVRQFFRERGASSVAVRAE